MSLQTNLNLNQKFETFSEVQTAFPNMAGFVLASEATTMTGLIVTYKGAEWLVIFRANAKDLLFDIPNNVLESIEDSIALLKNSIERLNHGLELDRKFSGSGRYEADSFKELSFDRLSRDLSIYASLLSKYGYNPAIVLNRMNCPHIPKMSEAAKDWIR